MKESTAATAADDLSLMAAIAHGDQRAFADLYDRHAALLHAVCLRVLGDRAEAQEVLSEVFMELWRRAERFDQQRGAAVPYLVHLTRSRAIDRLRSRRRERAVIVEPAVSGAEPQPSPLETATSLEPTPLGNALDRERRARVRAALDSLNETQRRAVELSFYQGLSHNEIATTLGEPLGTIKTRIRQGLLRLREALGPTYGAGAAG